MKRISLALEVSLALVVASSFYILHPRIISVQPFYVFLGVSFVLAVWQFLRVPAYRQAVHMVLRECGSPLIFFVGWMTLVVIVHGFSADTFQFSFLMDLCRTLLLIALFLIIVSQFAFESRAERWIYRAFLLSFTLLPALFVSNIGDIAKHQKVTFFGGYKLVGFQADDPTALAAWLVVAFAFCAVPIFSRRYTAKQRWLFAALSIISVSFIWWTNSRGAIIAAIMTLLVAAFFAVRAKHLRIVTATVIGIVIMVSGVLILPEQARIRLFVRFYPDYFLELRSNEFRPPAGGISSKLLTSMPTLTAAQERGTLWSGCPAYIIEHPLGELGPVLGFSGRGCGEHNSLFQAAVWGGWPAGAAFLWFVIIAIQTAFRFLRRLADDPLAVSLAMAFFGVLFLVMLNSFLQLKVFWIISALLIGYSYRKKRQPGHTEMF